MTKCPRKDVETLDTMRSTNTDPYLFLKWQGLYVTPVTKEWIPSKGYVRIPLQPRGADGRYWANNGTLALVVWPYTYVIDDSPEARKLAERIGFRPSDLTAETGIYIPCSNGGGVC